MSAHDPRSRTHPDHPTLAYQAWLWAMDGMIVDRPDTVEWTADDEELGNLLESAITTILCGRYGHYVEDDQCMIPAHRFCLWCNARMPDQPIGPFPALPSPVGGVDDGTQKEAGT